MGCLDTEGDTAIKAGAPDWGFYRKETEAKENLTTDGHR
jgi:hypothetical protein